MDAHSKPWKDGFAKLWVTDLKIGDCYMILTSFTSSSFSGKDRSLKDIQENLPSLCFSQEKRWIQVNIMTHDNWDDNGKYDSYYYIGIEYLCSSKRTYFAETIL